MECNTFLIFTKSLQWGESFKYRSDKSISTIFWNSTGLNAATKLLIHSSTQIIIKNRILKNRKARKTLKLENEK